MQSSEIRARTVAVQRHNLVEHLTSFVGREGEIAATCTLLSEARLVTLVGAGGVGKTRLAQRIGIEVLPRFPSGVWLVELAPLADAATIPQALAAVLGVPAEGGRALLDTVEASLAGPGPLLLIVDNCEHLVAGIAPMVARLLRACPDLTILATSREALGVDGETVRRVPSLSVPDLASLPGLAHDGGSVKAALDAHEATRLFVERASAVADRFVVTEQNAEAIAQICQRLDGIPLAIELAAARARILTPQQIAARLDDRFKLLTDGSRTALPRQRTLRAAIDWSYELLTEPERALLQRLAVFAGGCTLDAADAVAAVGIDDAEGADTLDLLGRLVDKSLVTVDLSGEEGRYSLLETIRAYAVERLEASGDGALVRGRHAGCFLAFGERAESELYGPDQPRWLDRLQAEHDNLRAALAWSLGDGREPVTALRLGAALGWFWFVRSLLGETRWLEAALAATGDLTDVEAIRARAACLCHLAWLGRTWRPERRPVDLAEQSLALSRAIGDRAAEAYTLTIQAMLLRDLRDFPRARAVAEQGIAIGREVRADRAVAHGLYASASVAFYASYVPLAGPEEGSDADTHGGQAQRDAPMPALPVYGVIEPETRRLLVPAEDPPGIELLEESFAISKQLGNLWGMAVVLAGGGGLAAHATLRRDFERAQAAWAEAFDLYERVGDHRNTLAVIRHCAQAAIAQRQIVRAIRLLAGFRAQYESAGLDLHQSLWPIIGLDWAAYRGTIAFPDAQFEVVWEQGRSMSLEQAVAYALRREDPFGDGGADEAVPAPGEPARAVTAPPAGRRDPSALTPREREVAILVGRGFSNRKIAEALVIAEKTAEVHARNVREKLGLESRAQIAAWAVQHGLLDDGE